MFIHVFSRIRILSSFFITCFGKLPVSTDVTIVAIDFDLGIDRIASFGLILTEGTTNREGICKDCGYRLLAETITSRHLERK